MDEWERLEREATAGPWERRDVPPVTLESLAALRAVVEAARNLAAARKAWNATPAGTAAEGAASQATDHAMHQVFDALKALDEVGHG